MADTQVEILSHRQCELGEGPSYDPATDTLWWFDILGRKLIEYRFADGSEIAHDLPLLASAIAIVDERSLTARQGMNKMQWDRRVRPKRLTATVEESAEGCVARMRLSYVPPAMGIDRLLRPLVEELRDEPAVDRGERPTPRFVPPLELLVVIAVLILFAMVGITPR